MSIEQHTIQKHKGQIIHSTCCNNRLHNTDDVGQAMGEELRYVQMSG